MTKLREQQTGVETQASYDQPSTVETMSLVNVIQITVLDNPASFTNPFQFEVTFECLQELSDDLEWKVIYVGSAEDSAADQVLEEVMVGPVPVGINKFVLQAAAPDHSQIPQEDLIGVTVVLVTCSFKDQEFIRIGYYVNNEYPEYDPEHPPAHIDATKLYRSILADQPRVTRFNVNWLGTGGHGADEVQPLTEEIVDENDENDLMEDGEDGEDEDEDDEDDNAEVDLEDEEGDGGEEEDEEEEGSTEDMAVEIIQEDSLDIYALQAHMASSSTVASSHVF